VTTRNLAMALIGAGLLAWIGARHESSGVLAQRFPLQKRRTEKVAPAKGVFLVAEPELGDPRFRESVVLLLSHGKGGTLGLIVNRDTAVPLSEALPDLGSTGIEEGRTVYFGGPVGLDRMLYLIREEEPSKDMTHVVGDVYFGGDQDALKDHLKAKKGDRELRLYIGHAGWSPGQLEREMELGSWQLVPADADTVFDEDADTLWLRLVEHRSPSVIAAADEEGE
jgi:putative transcriptional regulator